jgi:NAD(P)-dependent dehydrogenase (short-subunit alcohol dehydrogenase family)
MATPFTKTVDGFELQMGTNHLGHFAFAGLIKNQIKDRLVVVSSFAHRMGNFGDNNIETIRKVDIVFYITKLLSIFWPIIGLFSSLNNLFLSIIFINILKFVIYHLNDSLYKVYINFLPWINVLIYLTILFYKFIH